MNVKKSTKILEIPSGVKFIHHIYYNFLSNIAELFLIGFTVRIDGINLKYFYLGYLNLKNKYI